MTELKVAGHVAVLLEHADGRAQITVVVDTQEKTELEFFVPIGEARRWRLADKVVLTISLERES